MINKLLLSRFIRLYNQDIGLPYKCSSKWWYTDVYEECKCLDKCKFSSYTKKEWEKYADKCYADLVKANNKSN